MPNLLLSSWPFRWPSCWVWRQWGSDTPTWFHLWCNILSSVGGCLCATEGAFPSLIPGSQSWPADVYLPNWDRGRPRCPWCLCGNPPATYPLWSCQCYWLCPFCRRSQKSLSWSLIQGCGSVFRSPHLWIFGGFNTERPRPQNSLLHLADGLLGLRVALIPSSQSWPADVYLPNWDRRRPTALDVSVISTLQRLTLCGAANVIGYAFSAEDGKRASHEASCRDAGVSFRVLLIFESLGGLSDLGRKTLYSIGRLLGLRMGVPISDSVRHLFQRCSVCLWWGNATLWLHCFSCPPPQTDSIL